MSDQDFPPDLPNPTDGEGGERTSLALVSTIEPYLVQIAEVEDDRIPDGMVCMGSFLGERLIARSAVPPEMIVDITERAVFSDPVRLALAAIEEDPGLQCRLFALLPAAQFQESEPEPDEPWASSVPRYEDEVEPAEDEDTEGEAVVPLLLGHVVRFAADRKHPRDLAKEAADILQTILSDDTPLSSVVDKVLEDLLRDPPDTGPRPGPMGSDGE